MTRKKTIIGGFLLAVAGIAIGWSVRALAFPAAEEGEESRGGDEEAAPAIAPQDMSVRVMTAPVTQGELAIVELAPGIVKAAPAAERSLSSRAGGRVREVFATGGQHVKQGELLLRFETEPLEAALAQARAQLAQSENQLAEFERIGRDRQSIELQSELKRAVSALELGEAQLARLTPLHDEGLVSDRAFAEARQVTEQARSSRQLAERATTAFQTNGSQLQQATLAAAVDAAQANLHEAERILAETELRAPADGQLTAFAARRGERLEAGAAIGKLLVSQQRVISFTLTAKVAAELAPGARATWRDASGVQRSGTLTSLAAEIEPESGTLEALVAPDPEVPESPPGLSVLGELELRRLNGVVLVPERAIVRAHDTQVVVLATPASTARIVPVKVLGRHDGLAAIEGDVHAGERVIIDGGYNLPDGAHVLEQSGSNRIEKDHDPQGASNAAHPNPAAPAAQPDADEK